MAFAKAGTMRDKKRFSLDGRSPSSPRILIALFAILLLSLWCIAGPFGLAKLFRMKQRAEELSRQNIAAIKRNTEKRADIEALGNDPKVQEEFIRRELGWIRPGEIIYEFVETRK
ncbi:MAG: septum formation initiator family protein [Deltaproteobacteria bacterium]